MNASLELHYAALERKFALSTDSDYERLVVPQGNADEPVHRWFHMKEAYSPGLLPRLLKDLELTARERIRLHDPFAGSATTLVSGLLRGENQEFDVSGVEVNPFLHLLSTSKVRALSLSPSGRKRVASALTSAGRDIIDQARRSRTVSSQTPNLSAFKNPDYFRAQELRPLLRLRSAWQELPRGLSRDLLAIALAGCIEPSSRLRRDGRALRYEPTKRLVDPIELFASRVDLIAQDLQHVNPAGSGAVRRASSVNPKSWPAADTLDLVCFSPPYPNNIDYTEIYKLESWFLNLISSPDEFRAQRNATMQSHPSIVFSMRSYLKAQPDLANHAMELASPLLHAVPKDRYVHQRKRVIEGYLLDACAVLSSSYRSLVRGGVTIYVVGNSRHGSKMEHYTIASDVLLADLAEKVGFAVQEIKVARALHRRGRDEHLRESVVILRKP